MAVFLICLLWTFVLFSLLISFLSKNEDFQRAVGAFCRLPPLARAVFVVFISGVIVFGGSKPSALRSYDFTNWFTSGTLDDGPSLSDAQKAAGFALVAAKTNVVFDFNAPTNATVHDVWRKRGAAVDGFLLKPEDGWSFTLGTNTLDSVYVSSSGTIALEERRFTSPKGRMMPDSSGVSFLAPPRTSLGIVPEDNWHLLPNSAQSLFWHDVTQRGSTRFTWQNALPDRATNAPVSFQAELFNSGDFVFRYDIGTNAMPERFVIGAQAYNGGETALVSLPDSACSSNSHVCSTVWHTDGTNITSTPLCEAIGDASRFELRWSAFGEITGDDTDSDGIPDAYEILLYHTDPHLADTDGDGLSDGEEISSGMNPLDPDEDGDGYPDGIDPEEWLANPIWGHSAGATNLVVKLLGSLPDETRCTLSIGSLRLPLEDAQSWSLYLTPGVEYPFALLGAGHPVVRLAAADPSEMQPMAAPTPSGVRSGGDSGAFVLDDPSGVFSGSAVPDARGLMGFATIDLEAGIAPLWGDVCLHGPDPMLNIDLGEAVSPIFAQDKIQWDLGDAFAFTEMAPGVFRLIANSGTISACISPPESLFGFSGPSHISAHRHLGDGDPCVACGYVHKTIEGSATGCIHDKGCAALESIQADCSCAPGFIRVNSDDDDLNGSEDHTQTSVAEGEDDFLMFRIPEPMECYDYCDCSGEDNIYWEVASISPGLRLRLNGEIVTAGKRVPPSSLLAIEARSASAGFGTGQIEFEIHDESKEPEEEVLRRITRRFTAANAQIKPDRNDDGDVDVSDARIAPEWEETVWRVARREDPYLLSLQNECPGGMTPKVYLANDVSHPSVRIGVGDDSATIVPGGSAETGRNMTVNAWLDASGPGTSADLQYGILKSDNSWLYSDELTIEVVDVDLGERWIAAGETASYSFGDWAGNTEWYVLEDGYKIVNYGMGCEFSTSPSLPAGDYIVSADFNDPITGAFGSEGGALHIVDVDIEKDAYGAQCGSEERVKVSLDTAASTGPANWRIEPFVADGARLHTAASGGAGFQALSGLTEVWVSPGSIPQDYTITATHPQVSSASDTATFTGILLDLDVDSGNHWGHDYFTTDFRTAAADAVENQADKDISKVVFVNNIDKDSDGVPDFMDGWDCPLSQIPLLEREIAGNRGANSSDRFAPMILELAVPPGLAGDVRVKLVYPESRPGSMISAAHTWAVTQNGGTPYEVSKNATMQKVGSPEGSIRIWMKDGNAARTIAGDYVESNKAYSLPSLGMVHGVPKVFYVEGINASADWGDVEVSAVLSVDGGSTWMYEDAVRITCLKSNFSVGNVRPYYITSPLGVKKLFSPDYSTPSACLGKMFDAYMETGKHLALSGGADPWWHEGDAVLGHGFVYFQYEGPDRGDALSAGCAGSAYDGRHYWGKTGNSGFTFWDYGAWPFGPNAQGDLAWWDICPHKVDGMWLVQKRAYTLNPERLAALFNTFNDVPSRYQMFGLHIDQAVKGWGCLSNVGLGMGDHNLDDARMAQCRFSQDMPTTANRSVWNVVMGTVHRHRTEGKAGAELIDEVVQAVVDESAGLDWGDSVIITDAIAGSGLLGEKLFGILQGKEIFLPDGTRATITSEQSLNLYNSANDYLDYYDPGLYPIEFGDNPSDVFDVAN